MDSINCLKTLIEDVAKKQSDTIRSMEELSRRTERINSDISNLVNGLQMVGNRQFAEYRVREDNMMGEQMKNGSSTPIRDPQRSNSKEQLTLRSILLRAIELVPDTADETEVFGSGYLEDADAFSEAIDLAEQIAGTNIVDEDDDVGQERIEVVQPAIAIVKTLPILEALPQVPDKPKPTFDDVDGTAADPHIIPQKQTSVQQQPVPTFVASPAQSVLDELKQNQDKTRKTPEAVPLDRDRIADILKRYSLYDDDDEDDDDEDDESD